MRMESKTSEFKRECTDDLKYAMVGSSTMVSAFSL